MKRILSVITMLAVMLAMVVPTAVLAEDLNIASGTIALSYTVTNAEGTAITEAHPGDSVVVHAYATPDAEAATQMSTISMILPYDPAQLTPAALPANGNLQSESGFLWYLNKDAEDITLTSGERTEIFSHTFKVNDAATGVAKVGSATSAEQTSTVKFDYFTRKDSGTSYEGYYNNLTAEQAEFTITPNTITVTIDGDPISDGTIYYANSVSLVVDGTNYNSATLSKEGVDDVTLTKGVAQTVSGVGTYTLTVVVVGKTQTYTFTLNAPVSAQIDNTITISEAGYERDAKVEIPVKITNLGDAKAAMVSFGVTYEDTVFDLDYDNKDKVTVVDGKYVYGNTTNETPLNNGELITTFTLTVKADAAFGNTTITFTDADFALATAGAPSKNQTNLAAGIVKETQVVTIVPTADEAATFALPGTSAPWTNDKREVTVTPADGVTLGYAALESAPTDLKTAFGDAAKVGADNKLTAAEEKNYYVIAKVGEEPNAVYILVKTLTPTDLKLDKTEPTVTVTGNYSNWTDKLTIPASAIAVNADVSGVDKIEYCLDPSAASPEWKALTADGIVIAEDWEKTIQIKVTDNAGNFATEEISVKVDVTKPVVTVDEEQTLGEGGKTFTFTATDALSSLFEGAGGKVQASIYHSATQADLNTIEAIEELGNAKPVDLTKDGETKNYTGSYTTKEAGTYYIVVSDKAGNKGFGKATVAFELLPEASKLLVKTVKTDADFHEGFLPDTAPFNVTDENGNLIEHNGWFTYVSVQAKPREDNNYVNTLAYSTDGGETYTTISDNHVFDQEGTYKVKVTTTHKDFAADKQEAVYTFNIVPVAGIHATTGRNFYTLQDYARIKRYNTLSEADVNNADHKFFGGLFSGDVTGDLAVTSADLDPIIASLRSGEDIGGQKTIPIMNLPQE